MPSFDLAESDSLQHAECEREEQTAYYFNCCETLLKVVEALVPMVRIAPKQTTTIKANITAYSTAVGPSSLFKKLRILAAKFFMLIFSKGWKGCAKRHERVNNQSPHSSVPISPQNRNQELRITIET